MTMYSSDTKFKDMATAPKPNIDIKSNILPIKTSHPFGESDFLAQIIAYSALKKFEKIKFPYRVALTPAQRKILSQYTCSFIYNGHRVSGLVKRGDTYFIRYRCPKRKTCKHATKFCLNPELLTPLQR